MAVSPEQISCIYNLDDAGGLKADEIDLLEHLPIRARLVAPILVEGRVLGLIVGHVSSQERQWEQSEVDKFATVADRIGLVLQRQESIARRADRERNKNLLSDITLQLRQSFIVDEIIATALTSIRAAVELDRAYLCDPQRVAYPPRSPPKRSPIGTRSILGRSIEDYLYATSVDPDSERGSDRPDR